MYEVIQIRLREAGKITYFSPSGMKFKIGEYVIVEADRGLDYGQVLSEVEAILDSDIEEPPKKVIRKTNPWDMHQIEKNKKKIREVMDTCSKKIQERKLPMKLIDAEFSFDRSKIVFYFTAERTSASICSRIGIRSGRFTLHTSKTASASRSK